MIEGLNDVEREREKERRNSSVTPPFSFSHRTETSHNTNDHLHPTAQLTKKSEHTIMRESWKGVGG